MEPVPRFRSGRSSSCERLVAICLMVVAIVSPLYINRGLVYEVEDEDEAINLATWLPLLLLLLIFTIFVSLYLDRSLTRFDPYWIYRVGGSSGGIILILLVLALVLKCKASNAK